MKINIAKYVLELLLKRKNITIPGLGKFEVKNNPASFGEGRKSLLPPSKEFIFSEDHNVEDEVLKNHIMKSEDLDGDKANQFITKFTSNVSKGLLDNQPVELAYIGILKRNEGLGKVIFEQNAATAAKLNKSLPEVSLQNPKSVGDSPKMEIPVPETVPSSTTAKAKTTASQIKPKIKMETPKSYYIEPKEGGLLKWIVGTFLLLGFLFLGLKMCSKEDSSIYKSIDEPVAIVSKVDADIDSSGGENQEVTQIGEEVGENKIEKTSGSNEETFTGVSGASSNKDCIVIVGSMQNQKYINRLLNRIKDKNYKPYTEAHGAYTRVGVRVDCDEVQGTYKDFIRQVSNDFSVNAWSLSPEFPQ